ncbi:MAG: adenylate kinase [bacterium]
MLNLIFFGPPGVGKGTQAVKVANHYDLVHVSTGDILRAEITLETELGLKVKDIIASGELVPDELLIEILDNTCDKHLGANGFIFDGFPRTIGQAEALDSMMDRRNCRITQVLSLEVPEPELLRRLINRAKEEGRTDDTEDVIKNRLVVYYRHTKPLITHYTNQRILTKVYGMGNIEGIFKSLCQIIDRLV